MAAACGPQRAEPWIYGTGFPSGTEGASPAQRTAGSPLSPVVGRIIVKNIQAPGKDPPPGRTTDPPRSGGAGPQGASSPTRPVRAPQQLLFQALPSPRLMSRTLSVLSTAGADAEGSPAPAGTPPRHRGASGTRCPPSASPCWEACVLRLRGLPEEKPVPAHAAS